jgi:hypothetical protein
MDFLTMVKADGKAEKNGERPMVEMRNQNQKNNFPGTYRE